MDIPDHIKSAPAKTLAEFLDLSLTPRTTLSGDNGINQESCFDEKEISSYRWGYPTQWMDFMKESRGCYWSFSKEGRTFAHELETWWKAQPEADCDQYMKDETMDDDIVRSFS